MAYYVYKCVVHGTFEVKKGVKYAEKSEFCPLCGTTASRVYSMPPVHYRSDGFHVTDYGKGRLNHAGTKNDNLNKNWEHATGEKAPPPAADVPRNGDKY